MIQRPSNDLAATVDDIQRLHPNFVDALVQLNEKVSEVFNGEKSEFSSVKGEDWVLVANKEAITKLRLFIENNFRFLETVGLLATTRYVFECLVWLRLLESDPDYGVVFYYKTIKDQIEHREQTRDKYQAEATYFDQLGAEETLQVTKSIEELSNENASQEAISQSLAQIQKSMDDKARRNFSTYWSGAKINGFGFQAHLIRTQALPKLDQSISDLKAEKKRAYETLTEKQTGMIIARWNWKEKSATVGMLNAYEYIYSFTSRLLHATPSSMFTNQKNLEEAEMVLLCDFVLISLMDALDITMGTGWDTKA